MLANRASARALALAGYPTALLLIATSALDVIPKILPSSIGSRDWRYGALGLLFNSMVTPLLGLVIAGAAALIARHRKTLAFISALFLALGALTVVGGILFLVDFNALAPGLNTGVTGAFKVATWKTILIVLFMLPAAFWFGFGGLRAARGVKAVSASQNTDGNLVVGQ